MRATFEKMFTSKTDQRSTLMRTSRLILSSLRAKILQNRDRPQMISHVEKQTAFHTDEGTPLEVFQPQNANVVAKFLRLRVRPAKKHMKQETRKAYNPERLNPQTLSPARLSPQRFSPGRFTPQRFSPLRFSPRWFSPQRFSF